jgi:pyridinium-3,5-bisthiocarboxylic acid mononucleotide nickel chelatase
VQMKRGRPGFVLSALARPGDEQAVARAILRETSSLGVRIARLDRIELERESRTVEVGGEPVRVKVGRLDGRVVNLAPEHADCERAARIAGAPVKAVWARALAAAHEEDA